MLETYDHDDNQTLPHSHINYINTQPLYNPISHLVYAAQAHQVSDVWVAGKQLLNQGAFTELKESKLITAMQKWKNIISPDQELK